MTSLQEFVPYRRGLPPLRRYLRDVWSRREFISENASAALKGQHADSVLGRLWLILNPLLLAVVYYVLILVIGLRGRPNSEYFLYLLSGVFAFYFLSTALSTGTTSISSAGGLVLRHRLPLMVLPMSTTLAALRRFVPAVVLLLLGTILLRGWPGLGIWQAIPSFVLLGSLTFGAVLIAATAQVYVRDVAAIVPMVSRLGLYLSPVLYPPDSVPEPLLTVLQFNPVFWIMAGWTSAFGGTTPIPAAGWAIGCAWTVLFLAGGLIFFLTRERDFAAHV